MVVEYEELAGSPRISITQQGVTAERVFRVDWNDWSAFARLLLGTYEVIGQRPRFISPLGFPGQPNLLVWDVEVEPFDGECPDTSETVSLGARTSSYTSGGARVTVTYRTLFDENNASRDDLPRVPNGTYLTYTAELGAEMLPTPARVWNWKIDGQPKLAADVRPGLMIPTGSFRLDWQRVPLPPWDAIRQLRGRVNADTFVGSPPGTILFLGARAVRQFQFIEQGGFWRLEYQFVERTRPLAGGGLAGWNHFYRHEPVGGEHWIEIEDASGNPPYAVGDFQALFTFE